LNQHINITFLKSIDCNIYIRVAHSETVDAYGNARYKMSDDDLQNLSTFREDDMFTPPQEEISGIHKSMPPKACECKTM